MTLMLMKPMTTEIDLMTLAGGGDSGGADDPSDVVSSAVDVLLAAPVALLVIPINMTIAASRRPLYPMNLI